MDIKVGSTDKSVVIRIVDDTDGKPETGVVAATAGLAFNYRREGGLLVNIAGLSDLALLTSAHTDGGLLHIGHGYYRIDVPDAAFAAGSDGVLIEGTATGMVVIGTYVQLVGYDPRTELTAAVLAVAGAAAAPGAAMNATLWGGVAVGGMPNSTTPPTVGQVADAVYDEMLAGHVLAGSGAEAWAAAAACGAGAGAIEFIYTMTDVGTGLPIDGVQVWVSTDLAGVNVIVNGYTDAFGNVTFWLDPGSYYFWRQRAGYNFAPQPDLEVVV